MTEPRLFTRDQAAAYCSLAPRSFDEWVSVGKLPRPIEGTRRWDRKALDIAIDSLSGLASQAVRGTSALDEWRRSKGR